LISITVIWMVEQLDSPCVEEEESWFAPNKGGGLCLLYTNMGIGSDLVRVLLDLSLIASLETVGVGAVRVVLVGGDIGVMVALLGIHICLHRDVSSRTLLLAEETHGEATRTVK
jgi:hypothetical protein